MSSKLAVLLFGVALFSAMTELYLVAKDYHDKALVISDMNLIKSTAVMLPENGVQNLTLSRKRNISLSGSSCTLQIDGLNTTLFEQSCRQSNKISQLITVKKSAGVVKID